MRMKSARSAAVMSVFHYTEEDVVVLEPQGHVIGADAGQDLIHAVFARSESNSTSQSHDMSLPSA
jgi:ketosteroid isomerase-like protein